MNFNLLLAVSPILAVAIGGLLLMLAEAFGKPVALTGAQAGMVSTDAGAGRADELALGSAVVLFAGALISVALWKVGPESIPGVDALAPYLIIDRFSLFFEGDSQIFGQSRFGLQFSQIVFGFFGGNI